MSSDAKGRQLAGCNGTGLLQPRYYLPMRAALLIFFAAVSAVAQNNQFDLIITGAKVIDGTGAAWFYSDVGVKGDTIAAIGLMPGATATLKIDAKGLVVSPGFIDVHSHGDRGIFATPTAENYLREGVTSIIGGPDGSSAIPLAPFLKRVEDTHISINFGS